MDRIVIPINDAEEGESQTCYVVKLQGTKKRKCRDFRKFLSKVCKTQDVHKLNKITRDLGFPDLVLKK